MTDANQVLDVQDLPEKQPPGLYMMFFAELWERFCYYGMRALLAVYVAQLFMVQQSDASLKYGAFTALIYATGTFGGYVADKVLGFRRTILLGGLIMAAGEFLLIVFDQTTFLYGLALIVVGNGLFKPNISSLVGKMYGENDPRRDSGFTIFYMGINIGALIAPVICAGVSNMFPVQVPLDQLPPGMEVTEEWRAAGFAELPDYRWGFGLAGVGMLLGLATFWFFRHLLHGQGEPPANRRGPVPVLLVLVGCAVLTPLIYFLIADELWAGRILLGLAILAVVYIVAMALKYIANGETQIGQRMFALVILLFANSVFWSCFEQAGNSLNFFARDHVSNPSWFSFEYFQSVNPVYIVLLGPVFAWLWIRLSKANANPSIPAKFGLGLIQVGLGFGVILGAIALAGPDARTPFLLLFLLYLLHTTGELCISPVGLSMVTKLAPPSMTGLIMGAWFLSISSGNFVAGIISAIAGGSEAEGGADAASPTGEAALTTYSDTYEFVMWYAIGAGVVMLLLAKPINKLMHGIK